MAKGEIAISEALCKGCLLCVKFCPRGCILPTKDKLSATGYFVPIFAEREKCNACGICGWMCPDWAIQVYKYVEAKTS